MIEYFFFGASLLFASFVSWYCFQDSAKYQNEARLRQLRKLYISVPIRVRMARVAEAGAMREWILITVEAHSHFVYPLKSLARFTSHGQPTD